MARRPKKLAPMPEPTTPPPPMGGNNPPEAIAAFDEAPPPADEVSLASMIESAKELYLTDQRIADLENLLAVQKSRAQFLKVSVLPDKMAAVGMTKFTTDHGTLIEIEDFISGTIPKEPEKKARVFEEIEAWGAEAIIKNTLVLTFEKKEHAKAKKLEADLRKKGFNVEVTRSINHQTYHATIRERLKKGGDINEAKMELFIGRRAKITMPEAKK